jgi:two-component sensor histidine kinase
VTVSWKLEGVGDDRRLRLFWRESGGPRVTPPSRLGFGSTVLKNLVAQSLDAEIATDFASDGFWWELNALLSKVAATDHADAGKTGAV